MHFFVILVSQRSVQFVSWTPLFFHTENFIVQLFFAYLRSPLIYLLIAFQWTHSTRHTILFLFKISIEVTVLAEFRFEEVRSKCNNGIESVPSPTTLPIPETIFLEKDILRNIFSDFSKIQFSSQTKWRPALIDRQVQISQFHIYAYNSKITSPRGKKCNHQKCRW